jgi:hypothetical protein
MPATNAWDETKPAGSDLASTIDNQMRQMKLDIRERLALEHYWNAGISTDGLHKEITITPATTNTELLKTVSNQSITGTSAVGVVNLGATWNTTGAPTALKINVTDTSSDAASLLLDLQVGGVSKFSVRKDGSVAFNAAGGGTISGFDNLTVGLGGSTAANNAQLTLNGTDANGFGAVLWFARNGVPANITAGIGYWNAINGGVGDNSLNYWANDGHKWTVAAAVSPNMALSTTGVWSVNGLGVGEHKITGTGAGTLEFTVENTTSGVANYCIINATSGTTTFVLEAFSQGWTTSGSAIAAYGRLHSTGGLVLQAADAASDGILFYTGSVRTMDVGTDGQGSVIFLRDRTEAVAMEFYTGYVGSNAAFISCGGADYGANIDGAYLIIGNNTHGGGAPGSLRLLDKASNSWALWVDSLGKLRIGTAAPVQGSSDQSGTVVGTQT